MKKLLLIFAAFFLSSEGVKRVKVFKAEKSKESPQIIIKEKMPEIKASVLIDKNENKDEDNKEENTNAPDKTVKAISKPVSPAVLVQPKSKAVKKNKPKKKDKAAKNIITKQKLMPDKSESE